MRQNESPIPLQTDTVLVNGISTGVQMQVGNGKRTENGIRTILQKSSDQF